MEAPARPHRRLIWKYTTVVVALVAAASVSVGLTELYFSYQDSKRALARVERDQASSAALAIEQPLQDVLRELEAVAQPTEDSGAAGLIERNQDFHRLLGRDKLVSDLRYLDASEESVSTPPPSSSTASTAGSTSRTTRVSCSHGPSGGTSGMSTSSAVPSPT